MKKIRATVWNEYRHEKSNDQIATIYPEGIHGALAGALAGHADMDVSIATLDEPDHGLTDEVLDATDVLLWWGHAAHGEVRDDVVDRVHERVLGGMGIICLHSSHFSKIFKRLMGTTCNLKWREIGEKERIWVVDPAHPIAACLPECFEVPRSEMYGERFDIPRPDELVFLSWFAGGEVFRSGVCYHRGQGKVFYFRPGHETYPIYHQPEILQVIVNAVRWAAPAGGPVPQFGQKSPLERVG